ncbi:hypothetical protein, partial [Sansalvadorimonas verongulae]|uniref:hypothetical protein n=1 Tax=Sansalvadorimonas verongulae TaxID=2172824 RepID=UPI0012BD778D
MAESSTCSATPSKVDSPSATDDIIITGEFVDGFPLPFNSDINAWEIHCRKVVKQEIEDVYEAASILPGDLDYDGPAPAIEVLSQKDEGAICRGQQNTTCHCGATFASASLLKSHRR